MIRDGQKKIPGEEEEKSSKIGPPPIVPLPIQKTTKKGHAAGEKVESPSRSAERTYPPEDRDQEMGDPQQKKRSERWACGRGS